MKGIDVSIEVNGTERRSCVEPRLLLADFIRHELGLKGTHVGCEHGVCGCCTVLLDGQSVRSCLMFAVQADGHAVQTVEALGTAAAMHPIQQAFREAHGLQCGYCTPGMLAVAVELLAKNGNPSREQAREAVSNNLCRCTGYETIVDAILLAARKIAQAAPVETEATA